MNTFLCYSYQMIHDEYGDDIDQTKKYFTERFEKDMISCHQVC